MNFILLGKIYIAESYPTNYPANNDSRVVWLFGMGGVPFNRVGLAAMG